MKYVQPFLNYFLLCLLFVRLIACSSPAAVTKQPEGSTLSDFVVWTPDLRSDELKNSYQFLLKTPKNSVTGICVLKKMDAEWRGTLINEMGVKVFDFIVTDKKCELLNVISMMDKWYIKKTVAADLYFLFNADNPNVPFQKRTKRFERQGINVVSYAKKQILVQPDDAVLLVNGAHRLLYELRKIHEIEQL